MAQAPVVLVHCDWSINPAKRWMARAERRDGWWTLHLPELVGPVDRLIGRLRHERASPLVVGLDLPLGLPEPYGARTGLPHFRAALGAFGHGPWADWFTVAAQRDEISLQRPFYPLRPGGTQRRHLVDALGAGDFGALLRQCERQTGSRPAAASLFWTLGGNQVGKAAISGWRELVIPQLEHAALWPFDGSLAALLETRELIFAETYPGDVYPRLGLHRRPSWSKRVVKGRLIAAPHLLRWLGERPVTAPPAVAAAISAGFPFGQSGEDQFDALVGLMGMLDVVDGRVPEGAPATAAIRRWEGWILGQQP